MSATLTAGSTADDDLGGIAGWAVSVMEALGAPGAGFLIALENLFPPLPSEVVLPVAGFTASRGDFTLASALFWTTLGSVVGALVLYGLGRSWGRDRTFALWQRLPLVRDDDFVRTEAWFSRHGRKAVFLGRMVPIFRSLISVPAGVDRMPLWQFTALTTAGSMIWNTVFVVAGHELGEQWHRVESVAGYFQLLVLAAVALGLAWYVVRRVRSRSTAGSVESDGPTSRLDG